jgi:hypothetical protein
MREHKCKKIFSALLAFLLFTPLIGCGSSSPDPEELITKAQLAIKEVETYRLEMMVIHTENGETTQSNGQFEFVSPDRMHTTTVNADDTTESIRIGQIEYRLDTFSSNWQVRQWPESFPFTNMAAGMVEMLGSLVGIVEMTDEEIDGVDCFHYKGNIDMKAKGEEEKAKLDPSQPDYEERMRALEMYDLWQTHCEFWLGKGDYLLRQLKQDQEVIFIRDAGEDTEREERQSITVTFRFYDFNTPITIEAPLAELVEGIYLTVSSTSSIGGKDLQHQQIKYEISISNKGSETAREVRVFIDSLATNQGFQTMEAEPSQSPVDLGSNEHETYTLSWEYDLTRSSKEELVELMKENVLRAVWLDEKGQQHEKVLSEGG